MTKDEGRNRFAKSFLKQTEYIHSMFISFFFDQSGRFWPAAGLNPELWTLNPEPLNRERLSTLKLFLTVMVDNHKTD